ncbi:MAG TPA: Gfo/Idh/MocA family oxidoreductase, partial [bacterium]|nr:Gfo/Idh/MocA family oxidoreductase [bacterium]
MKKWKIGIVGLSRGKGFVNVFSSHPEVEVTALCDIDEKKLEEVGNVFKLPDSARFSKFNDFVNADTDMVMVATPIPLHTEHTVKSLEAGKHVLCEQTVAYTVEECSRVVDAVKRTGRTYMMGENYCYFHYVREWKKVVESGKLGEIVYAEGEYIHEIVSLLVNEKTGEFFWRHERPPIWYCAHTLGPILMVMNDRVVKGCGLTSGFKAFPQYKDHPGFLDFEIGLFKTEKGAVVKILRSQVPASPHFVWYSLYGTRGHLENKRTMGEGFLYVKNETPADGEIFTSSVVDPNAPEEAK